MWLCSYCGWSYEGRCGSFHSCHHPAQKLSISEGFVPLRVMQSVLLIRTLVLCIYDGPILCIYGSHTLCLWQPTPCVCEASPTLCVRHNYRLLVIRAFFNICILNLEKWNWKKLSLLTQHQLGKSNADCALFCLFFISILLGGRGDRVSVCSPGCPWARLRRLTLLLCQALAT